jgi:hypothetical protein
MAEPQRPRHPAHEKTAEQAAQQSQARMVGADPGQARAVRVPVQQLAQLDADVGDDPGHVGGPDFGVGQLGHQRVLQAHHEAQQHHGDRHEQACHPIQARAQHAEGQQQQRLQQQRQCVLAGQRMAARVVDQHGRAGGAGQKGQDGAERIQRQAGAEGQAVGRGGDDPGHVRGVAVHGEEAAGIGGAGHEGQRQAQVAVGAAGARGRGQGADVVHAASGTVTAGPLWK